MVKAKQHSNPIVLDTVETTPTATSFCAISIHVFLPRLCGPTTVWGVVASLSYNHFLLTVCVRKTECGHVWQPGFLSSWAACLTKLHKAYFSNRFFAPATTRWFGATSCNMARSVSISAMLRHLLGTRDTNVEYLKLVTMMMVNDKILAALWWNHHLDCLTKKLASLGKIECPFYRSKIQLLRMLLRIFFADKTQKVQIWKVIAFICAQLLHYGCAIHNLNLNLGVRSVNDVKFHLKKRWAVYDLPVTSPSWLEQ